MWAAPAAHADDPDAWAESYTPNSKGTYFYTQTRTGSDNAKLFALMGADSDVGPKSAQKETRVIHDMNCGGARDPHDPEGKDDGPFRCTGKKGNQKRDSRVTAVADEVAAGTEYIECGNVECSAPDADLSCTRTQVPGGQATISCEFINNDQEYDKDGNEIPYNPDSVSGAVELIQKQMRSLASVAPLRGNPSVSQNATRDDHTSATEISVAGLSADTSPGSAAAR